MKKKRIGRDIAPNGKEELIIKEVDKLNAIYHAFSLAIDQNNSRQEKLGDAIDKLYGVTDALSMIMGKMDCFSSKKCPDIQARQAAFQEKVRQQRENIRDREQEKTKETAEKKPEAPRLRKNFSLKETLNNFQGEYLRKTVAEASTCIEKPKARRMKCGYWSVPMMLSSRIFERDGKRFHLISDFSALSFEELPFEYLTSKSGPKVYLSNMDNLHPKRMFVINTDGKTGFAIEQGNVIPEDQMEMVKKEMEEAGKHLAIINRKSRERVKAFARGLKIISTPADENIILQGRTIKYSFDASTGVQNFIV